MKKTKLNKNIFCGTSTRAMLSRIIYSELIKGNLISYRTIIAIYDNKDYSFYDNYKISTHQIYGELKKAFKNVVDRLKEYDSNCIITDNSKKTEKTFKFSSFINDPLCKEYSITEKKYIDDYVDFCLKSADFFPIEWLNSNFKNSQLLLDYNLRKENGLNYICTSNNNQNLKNIQQLPEIFEYITNKQVIKFDYTPFDMEKHSIIFHPQFLKEYNRRWYVLGKVANSDIYPFNIAIDRIDSDIKTAPEIPYISAKANFYNNYFKNIVGVTHEKSAKLENVIIHTLNKYTHGLIETKFIHDSQKTIKEFGEYNDGNYGVIALQVETNRELITQILNYGDSIKIISPKILKEKVIEILKSGLMLYNN